MDALIEIQNKMNEILFNKKEINRRLRKFVNKLSKFISKWPFKRYLPEAKLLVADFKIKARISFVRGAVIYPDNTKKLLSEFPLTIVLFGHDNFPEISLQMESIPKLFTIKLRCMLPDDFHVYTFCAHKKEGKVWKNNIYEQYTLMEIVRFLEKPVYIVTDMLKSNFIIKSVEEPVEGNEMIAFSGKLL
jgi:hypothetical protein